MKTTVTGIAPPPTPGEIFEQVWVAPAACAQCSRTIPAGQRYWRITYSPDAADPSGRDLCPQCSEAGKPTPKPKRTRP